MSKTESSQPIVPDNPTLLKLYRHMVTIRRFEEQVMTLYTKGEIPGITHVSIGQEAVAAGVCAALLPDDYITSTHRGHGHCIAKGARVDRMFAELYGKVEGYCRGKGGSMHIADPGCGHLGANAIIGGGIGIATGAGLTAKIHKSRGVAVCFMGDGALNQGILFECLNLASIWNLPVLYVCENNQYAEYSPTEKMTSGNLVSRGEAFDIPSFRGDGNDVLKVLDTAKTAVERGRSGQGPSFLVFETYRYFGHGMSDPDRPYRTRDEEKQWRETKDPIDRFTRRLLEGGHARQEDLDAAAGEIDLEIERGIDFARNAAAPAVEEVTTHVYE